MKHFDWAINENAFFVNNEFKLETMQNALRDLNNPHLNLNERVIHIAGTNGKGSTASYIKTILETSGKKVGIFTSPHLIEFNERIYCNGRYIYDIEIERYRQQILQYCKNYNNISFFEATTLMAILFFNNIDQQERIDYFIFEVGLGGRLDATNIFPKPYVSVITSISFDHEDKLGNTIEKIASEKGGIIKHNVPIFTSNDNEKVLQTLRNIAKTHKSPFFDIQKNYQTNFNIQPSLYGQHQIINARLAAEVCHFLKIDRHAIEQGITKTKWPGRLQKINLNNINKKQLNITDIYIDGAHNEDGIKVLCDYITYVRRQNQITNKINVNIIGIFAALQRKNYRSFFPVIKKTIFDKLLFFQVPSNINDFATLEELVALAQLHNINYGTINDFSQLSRHVQKQQTNIIFIFGSLYFIGWVMDTCMIKEHCL